MGVTLRELIAPLDDSQLAMSELRASQGTTVRIGDPTSETLLYVFDGSGSLETPGGAHAVERGSAAFVAAGAEASLVAGPDGLAAVNATVGPDVDRHAPIGPLETVVHLDSADAGKATGARSFQILFGPHNGSTPATLFAGFIPPGKAPWHYHLYDEIVWVPDGPGRLHVGDSTEELGAGSAFRLRPRQVHIVQNLSAEHELMVIGVFTPAGSPSAAYLTPDVAAEYRFAG